jgi:hypothetical protein
MAIAQTSNYSMAQLAEITQMQEVSDFSVQETLEF